jgi:atypical dual specificity phosphatase
MLVRKIYSLVFGKPSNFSWLRPGKLAGSGMPYGQRAFRWLRDHGVSAIITLTAEGLDERTLQQLGYTYNQQPLVNRAPADPPKLDEAVNFITSQLAEGRRVLVHCQAGQGRTGMVLAAYLVKSEGMSAEDAITEVRRLRPGSLKRAPQREAVKRYEEYLRLGERERLQTKSEKTPASKSAP